MKKLSLWALTISLCVMLVAGCATMNAGPDPAADAAAKPGAPADAAAAFGYIEKIAFDKSADKEKVVITTSRLMGYTASRESARTLVVTFDRMMVPDELKRKTAEGGLNVIEGVTGEQVKTGERPVATLRISLRDAVPHLVREEGNRLIVDVDTVSLPRSEAMKNEVGKIEAMRPAPKARENKVEKKESKVYTGQKITADFQDANVRSVFRL
ncbi:MAG TPA: hypothetical protein PKN59_11165, partial [Syntrophales bacterium]|nr:hypothetical protein [Syntrophales bacterium]